MSVSVVVVCVIRIPQIQPVEVGCVVAYAFRRAFAHFGIIVENLKVAGFVGIFFVVKVKAVYHVVYLEMAGFRLVHTKKHGSVVRPAGIQRGFHVAFLVFGYAENRGIVVVCVNIVVSLHIVLVHPCACGYV